MTLRTPLTERLAIQHPVLLAPMDIVSDARLTAAVSAAGGLGLLGGGYGDEDWLRRELDALAAAKARFGVGFITWSLARQDRLLDLTLEREPALVMLSFGDVRELLPRIQRAGVPVLCQVQTLAMAREAVAAGADMLVAAGGIADGRGLAAALMLGAAGVLVGTRFYASDEAAGAPAAKQRIVAATGDASVRSIVFDISRRNVWPAPFNGRCLRNAHTERWLGRELELMQNVEAESARYLAARQAQDFDIAAVIAGEAAGLIRDVQPAARIVAGMVEQAEGLLARRGA